MHLLAGESLQRLVVVALVGTAGNPHHGALHALQGVPHRVDVGGLRVVDPEHAAALGHRLEPVLHGVEAADRAAHLRGVDPRGQRGQRRGHGVVGVVQASDAHLGRVDLDRGAARRRGEAPVAQQGALRPAAALRRVARREGELPHAEVAAGQLPQDHLVVARVDEPVAGGHVAHDAHLRVHVVLEAVVVAVEVVGRDVRQHADMSAEVVHAVELERAQLQHIPVVATRGHGVGEALADVAAQRHVQPRVAQDLVDERRGGRLAVRPGDADALRAVEVAARELHLGDDGDAALAQAPHDGRRVGNAGGLDRLRGLEDQLLGVAPLLVGDLPLVEPGLVAVGDAAGVRQQDVEAFFLGEDRGAVAADAAAQYDDFLHREQILFFHLKPRPSGRAARSHPRRRAALLARRLGASSAGCGTYPIGSSASRASSPPAAAR